jgi:hypothetical protein
MHATGPTTGLNASERIPAAARMAHRARRTRRREVFCPFDAACSPAPQSLNAPCAASSDQRRIAIPQRMPMFTDGCDKGSRIHFVHSLDAEQTWIFASRGQLAGNSGLFKKN